MHDGRERQGIAMPIKYRIRKGKELLRVVSSGVCDDLNELKAYIVAIHDAAQEAGVRRILVDEGQLVYRLSTFESYRSGRFISEISPQPIRIAVVASREGWEATRFWETVAVNRGVPVKVFVDLHEAEAWVTGVNGP
jgi:hypothetical protein